MSTEQPERPVGIKVTRLGCSECGHQTPVEHYRFRVETLRMMAEDILSDAPELVLGWPVMLIPATVGGDPPAAPAQIHIGDPVLVNDEPYAVRRVTDVPDSDAIALVIGPAK